MCCFPQWNFILVVGEEELKDQSVNVRNRDDAGVKGKAPKTIKLDEVVELMTALKKSRRTENQL